MTTGGSTTGSRRAEADSSVLHAKLRPAANPALLVRRPRLLSLLDEAAACPLTLVVAPAGSGKTSLLASWVAESRLPSGWLSLDESDRDPVQLWTGVIAALDRLLPGCGDRAAALLPRPGAVLEAVGLLLDDLESAQDEPVVLVVDDLQSVDDVAVAVSSLALFLQHLPACLHVVALSRRAPALPVDRLRVRGQLREIHFAELRFSVAEAEEMLRRLVPSLPEEQAGEMAARAGGWAASIQLAGIAVRSNLAQGRVAVGELDGELLVENYVWREVLASEDPDLVAVLMDTAVVDRVDVGLAAVLTGRDDVGELLGRAEERGLFVSRIQPSRWYEVHGLVREVLLAELAGRSPGRREELHQRAARWFEEHDQVTAALEHWLQGGRPREALRLLAAHCAALYDSGREATILRTVARIPVGVATADVDSMTEYAWSHVLVDRHRFLVLVDQLAAWVASESRHDAGVDGRMQVLESVATTIRGDWAEGGARARRAVSTLGQSWWLDPLGRFAWNMIAREVALSERWDETGSEVRAVVQALSVDPERRIAFEGTRALGEALAGRPVDAIRVAAGSRQAAEVANMTILRAELSVAEAIAHRELGDSSRAVPELLSLADTPVEPVPYGRLLACLELVQARLDEGSLDAAATAFDRAQELVDADFSGGGAWTWVARQGAVLALAAGNLDDARGWSQQVRDPFWGGVSRARVLRAEGDHAAARAALDTAVPRCVRHAVVRDLLLSRVAETPQESEKALLEAAERAAANGLVQTVASEGRDVVESIEQLAWQVSRRWLDSLRRATVPSAAGPAASFADLVEPLTEREHEVLRMLPSRLTLREIAGELSISMNTLKFHLKVIYRKLGCTSRAEAAEVARAVSRRRRAGQSSSTLRR